ncbi:MAG: histidine phosphatase family protein [Actinomycetota bacterium]|nr:histidine phosphatase family protein [Actinomycetota bacterium]
MEQAILVRHAESELSARRAVSGDPRVVVGLTPVGEAQARGLGRALAKEAIDLCVVTEFERTRRTAALALHGRRIPVEVWPELNDPRAGDFEGGPLDAYRRWCWAHGSRDEPPGGGESRLIVATRYAEGFRRLLARPEASILVVLHSLPLAYLLGAARGDGISRRVELVEYARAYRLTREELCVAVERLDAWCAAPTW